MTEIDREIEPEWCRPQEGSNNVIEEVEHENTKFGMITFDRLCESIEEEKMQEVFNVLLNETAKYSDWRYKYSFIMSVTQLGEYIEEAEKVKPLVHILIDSLKNESPKVRYAALHAIG